VLRCSCSVTTRVFYSTDGATPLSTATAATAKTALTTNSLIFRSWCLTLRRRRRRESKNVCSHSAYKVDGKDYYIMVVHPDCLYDLMNNTTFQTAMREALERGKDNPIFAGAKAITSDGVIIHESEFVATGTDAGAGSNVPWAKCVFFGLKPCSLSGEEHRLCHEGLRLRRPDRYGLEFHRRLQEACVHSLDFGSFGVYLARTNISG